MNASYFAELAMRAQPRIGDEALRRATELDPLNSAYWIRRGVHAEFARDLNVAERFYLEASRVSRLFSPRITLMNFYFRQGNQDQFWKWARAAFEMSYGDLGGTFLLCWQMAPDASTILDRALPQKPWILAQFLKFVAGQAGVGAALPVADVLLSRADADSREALLDYCEALLADKRFPAAREIWLGLARRGLLAGAGVGTPKHLLYNAALQVIPIQRGIDWKVISDPEIEVAPSGYPSEVAVTFTAKQPERCGVLSQAVALDEGDFRRFSFEYRTTGSSDPGLIWQIEDLETRAELARLPLAESEDWTRQTVEFNGRSTPFIRIVLKYERTPGKVRYRGSVLFRQLRLDRAN